MGLTRSNWTKKTINRAGKSFLIARCTVTQTTSEKQAFTKAITFLDPARPFKVHANVTNATLDGTALPVDILGSPYLASDKLTLHGSSVASMDVVEESSSSIVTHNGSTVASSGIVVGGIVKASLAADVKALVGIFEYKPDSTAADITLPTIWLNLDGAGALAAETCHWMVTQDQTEKNVAYR